jgi:sterol desaturase/sphingolipid hydroxylase (fatty acid hydroxylase superfamily)
MLEALSAIALEYVLVFGLLLLFAYLVPAGALQWLTAVAGAPPIQSRRPTAADVRREVRDSLAALLLFAAYTVATWHYARGGGTALYWRLDEAPLLWLPASVLAAAVLHDTWFYWTHRLMHLKPLFRHVHAGHHASLTPTPWAILSFQPLETVPQFGFFLMLVCVLPMHPAALFAYLLLDGLINAAGHCGHELVPERYGRHWLLKYVNAVTHHDLHHARFRCNFGQYFNVWDRLMGSFLDREPVEPRHQAAGEVARASAAAVPSSNDSTARA